MHLLYTVKILHFILVLCKYTVIYYCVKYITSFFANCITLTYRAGQLQPCRLTLGLTGLGERNVKRYT